MIRKLQPDAVVIATGARQKVPDLPGINGTNVVLANNVLSQRVRVRSKW